MWSRGRERNYWWKLDKSKQVDNHGKCKAELSSNYEIVYSVPERLVLTVNEIPYDAKW